MTAKKDKKSPHAGKFIIMNIDHGAHKKGAEFYYDTAPREIQIWADLPGIKGETRVVTVLDKASSVEKAKRKPYVCLKCGHIEGQPLVPEKTTAELNQEKIDLLSEQEKTDTTVFCKGKKVDDSPCIRTGLKEGTDYCFQHQPK